MNDSITFWHNPTDKTVSVKLWRGPENAKREHKWYPFVVEPGATQALPAEYDKAIKVVNEHGEVMGGKAPSLVKVDPTKAAEAKPAAAPAPAKPAAK